MCKRFRYFCISLINTEAAPEKRKNFHKNLVKILILITAGIQRATTIKIVLVLKYLKYFFSALNVL